MSLWTVQSPVNHDVYTVVYLLKDALRSALEDAFFFERAHCPKPETKGANHAEISARLGRFRDTCNTFREREALMLAKLLRAREWASTLRKMSPDLQDSADQFLEATSDCPALQAEFVKDPQRIFNGGGTLSRFLTLRRGAGIDADFPRVEDREGYFVGGKVALLVLRVSCEVFLSQIEEEFFPVGGAVQGNDNRKASFLDYLEAAEGMASAPNALVN